MVLSDWGAATLSPLHGWQRLYEDAVVETDRARLPVLINAARAAIDARMEQIRHDHRASAEELQGIEDALSGLRVLNGEADTN